MKKLIYTVATLVTFSLVACGPSAEELAKKEQMRLDSIAQVEAEVARVAAEAETARLAEEAKQKAIQDSITMADEAAAAAAAKKGGKVKPKPATPKPAQGTNVGGAAGRGGSADQPNKTGAGGRK